MRRSILFDEPYRWVEAVAQRREYIEEQIRRSSPVIAASVTEGIVYFTFYKRIPKVYEIYDGIAMGSIGHPADIETIRMLLLNAAHMEGYQRSPKDVTLNRLILFSLSPRLKNAFEEVGASPMLVRSIFAETGGTVKADRLMAVDFDGNVEEGSGTLSIAGSSSSRDRIQGVLSRCLDHPTTLQEVLPVLLEAYMAGVYDDAELGMDSGGNVIDPSMKEQALRRLFEENTQNTCLLDRQKGSLVPVSLTFLNKEVAH